MKTLITIILLTLTLTTAAQKDDPAFPKFGKVSEQDFKPTDLDDLGYDAVMLVNEKKMYFDVYNGQLRLYNYHHIRLRALKDGFHDDQIFTIPYSGQNDYERVIMPRCWVFSKNGGKISTRKTKFKNIANIDRDSMESRMVITPPAVNSGDVIDLEYTHITFDFMLPPIWKFNAQYPCIDSRLVTSFPHFMKYKYDCKGANSEEIKHGEGEEFISMSYNYSPQDNPRSPYYTAGPVRRAMLIYKFRGDADTFKVHHTLPVNMFDKQDVSRLYGTSAVRMRAAKFTQDIGYTGLHYTAWQQLTHLLYVYADSDNRTLSQNEAWQKLYNAGYVLVSSNDWQRLHKRLKKSPDFWKPIAKAVTIPESLRDLSDPDTPLDTLSAMRRTYDYVHNTMTWDSTGDNHITRSIENILKSRRGNTAEINMALISLLRHQGIDAFAALTSTTGFGDVDTSYANVAQFDAVLACVPYENRLILLDATAKESPFGKLPAHRYDPVFWAFTPVNWFFIEATFRDDDTFDAKKMDE